MLTDIAAKTPFQLSNLTDAYVKLVNQGFKPTRDQIIQLGDLSASVGKDFMQLTEAILDAQTGEFERLKEFGIKAQKEGDKITFTFRGQKTQIDNTAESIRNYVLGLGDLQGVKGSMEAISKTLVGQVSNLQDAVTNMFNQIGQNSEGILSGAISAAKFLVDNYEAIGKALGVLIATYGSYKAVLITVNALHKAKAIYETVNGAIKAAQAIDAMTVAMTGANAATKTQIVLQGLLKAVSPMGWITLAITGIAALTTGYLLFNNKQSEAGKLMQKHKEIHDEYAGKLDEEKVKTEQLIKTVQNDKLSRQQRLQALEDLKSAMPGYIDNLSLEKVNTEQGRKALADYNKELENKIWLEANSEEMAKLQKRAVQIKREREGVGGQPGTMAYAQGEQKGADKGTTQVTGNKWSAQPTRESTHWRELDNKLLEEQTAITRQLAYIEKERVQLQTQSTAQKPTGGTGGVTSDSKKKLKEVKEDYSAWYEEIERMDEQSDARIEQSMQSELDRINEVSQAESAAAEKKGELQAKVLQDTMSLNQQILQIEQEYAQKEAALKESSLPGELESRLEVLNKEKQAEIDALNDKAFEETSLYKQITATVVHEGKKQLQDKIANIKKALLEETMSAEKRKQLLDMLAEAEKKLSEGNVLNLAKGFDDVANILGSMSGLIGEFDDKLGKTINDAANLAGNLGQAIAGFGTGDVVGGITGTIGAITSLTSIIQNVFGDSENEFEKVANQIERMNILLEAQMDILAGAVGTAKLDAYKTTLKSLTSDVATLQANIDKISFTKYVEVIDEEGNLSHEYISVSGLLGEYITKYGDVTSAIAHLEANVSSGMYGASDEDKQSMLAYLEELKTKQQDLNALQSEYWEYISGTTSTALIDSLVEMFQQGKTSAADFADTFKDLMSKSLLQVFRVKMLEGPLTEWFEKYAEGIAGGNYNTSYWMVGMQEQLQAIGADATKFWEELQKNFPDIMGQLTGTTTTGGESSITGSIKGVSEETASILAGQINGIRINQAMGLDIMRDQLMELSAIRANTQFIRDIKTILVRIERNGAGSNGAMRNNGIMI